MLANSPGVEDQLAADVPAGGEQPAPAARRRWPTDALTFGAGTALVLVYALRGSGSYDNVVFGEHGLVIWCLLAIGFAAGVLPRRRPSRELLALLLALLGYSAWTALSLVWSESSELTTQELSRALGYLGLVAFVGTALDRSTWRTGALGLGFGAMVVCVLSVGGRLAPSVFPHDHLAATLGTDRLSYPFGYWNSVGAWGAMSVALGIAWSAHDGVRIRRAVALGLVPFAGLAVYLSYSRAGIIGAGLAVVGSVAFSRNRLTAACHALAAGAGTAVVILVAHGQPQIARATGTTGAGAVFAALAFGFVLCAGAAVLTRAVRFDRWRLPQRSRRPVTALIVVVLVVPLIALGVAYGHRAWRSFSRTPAPGLVSASPTARLASLSTSRYPLWKSAVHAWEAHPFDGTGAGTWPLWWNRHGTDAEYTLNTHNLWLENLAELGVPGLLLIIALAVSALAVARAVRRRALRSLTAGAAAAIAAAFLVYLWAATVDWTWQSTAVTVLALALVAASAARLSSGRWSAPVWLRAGLAVAAAGIAVVQIPGIASTIALRHSQSAASAGNVSVALSWARDAVSAEPWSASAYEQKALVEESAGQLPQAADDERRAIAHEPTNYVHWLLMARIQTERGLLDVALRDYRQARSLRPLAAVFRLGLYFATPGHPFGILP
jgi:O-antigen ligase